MPMWEGYDLGVQDLDTGTRQHETTSSASQSLVNGVSSRDHVRQPDSNPETPPRTRFLLRQTAIVVWQYLMLDLFATVALQQAMEQKTHETLPPVVQWDLSTEQWIERLVSNLIAGAVVSRILIDFHHRVFSIILVGVGLESPSGCPPLFGRYADAGSLRGFWG